MVMRNINIIFQCMFLGTTLFDHGWQMPECVASPIMNSWNLEVQFQTHKHTTQMIRVLKMWLRLIVILCNVSPQFGRWKQHISSSRLYGTLSENNHDHNMHCHEDLRSHNLVILLSHIMIIHTSVGKELLEKSSTVYNKQFIYNTVCSVLCGTIQIHDTLQEDHSFTTQRKNSWTICHTTQKHKSALISASQQTFRILQWSYLVLYKLYSLASYCFCLLTQRHNACCRVKSITFWTLQRISVLILQRQKQVLLNAKHLADKPTQWLRADWNWLHIHYKK
jgi:hypothetical protein